MNNRIKSLADVKLPGKDKLRESVIKRYSEQDICDFPFKRCMAEDATKLLEQGHVIKTDIVYDCAVPADSCTDVVWVLELEDKNTVSYILLKCNTVPSEDDTFWGYSHMVFERYDFESFPKYI